MRMMMMMIELCRISCVLCAKMRGSNSSTGLNFIPTPPKFNMESENDIGSKRDLLFHGVHVFR